MPQKSMKIQFTQKFHNTIVECPKHLTLCALSSSCPMKDQQHSRRHSPAKP
jgi:hypothetical protein